MYNHLSETKEENYILLNLDNLFIGRNQKMKEKKVADGVYISARSDGIRVMGD